MADHTFKYPTVAGATTTLTFPRAFFRGDTATVQSNQAMGQSLGGTLMVESFAAGYTIQPFTVQVPRTSESATDWTDVETFVKTTVNFGENTFWWTDDSSVSREVRLMNTSCKPTEYATYNEYTFQLRLV